MYFINCPFLDFTSKETCEKFASSIKTVRQQMPVEVPVVLDYERQDFQAKLERHCPSDTSLQTAKVAVATNKQCQQAVDNSYSAYDWWREVSLDKRCDLLTKLAEELESDRFNLAALVCLEVGKPWADADADVAEAIDFCRYYAARALVEIGEKKQGDIYGEVNILSYEGRGPSAVIAATTSLGFKGCIIS